MKDSLASQRFPFLFSFLLDDGSSSPIKVLVWNVLVGTYFNRLKVGQVVAIRGFRMKLSRAEHVYEITLNPQNPIGSIRLISSPNNLEESTYRSIPPLSLTFQSLSLIKDMPDQRVSNLLCSYFL
jgi:hypothetical protein